MTSPSEAEVKARQKGKVYVLAKHRNGRNVIPHDVNVGTRLLQRMDDIYSFSDPAVREFLDSIRSEDRESREWMSAAESGVFYQRRVDTWERVYLVLRERAAHGATSAEIERLIGLGHGAVSGTLSRWDQAGTVVRLRGDEE